MNMNTNVRCTFPQCNAAAADGKSSPESGSGMGSSGKETGICQEKETGTAAEDAARQRGDAQ